MDGVCFANVLYEKLGLTNSPQHNNKAESNDKTFQVPSSFLGFGWHTLLCMQHVFDSLEGL